MKNDHLKSLSCRSSYTNLYEQEDHKKELKQFTTTFSTTKRAEQKEPSFLKTAIYDTFITFHVVEKTVSKGFIFFCLFAFNIIVALFNLVPKGAESGNKQLLCLLLLDLIYTWYGYFAIMTGLFVYCVFKNQPGQAKRSIVSCCIYMTISFTYIVYPLMIASILCDRLLNHRSWTVIAFHSIIICFGGFFVLMNLRLRNTHYCESALAMQNTTGEIISYFLATLSMVVSLMGEADPSSQSNQSSEASYRRVSISLLGITCLTTLYYSPYWKIDTFTWQISWQSRLFLLRLMMAITCPSFSLHNFLLFLLIQSFLQKIFRQIAFNTFKIDIFDKKLSLSSKIKGFSLMIALLCDRTKMIRDLSDRELMLFYGGLVERGFGIQNKVDSGVLKGYGFVKGGCVEMGDDERRKMGIWTCVLLQETIRYVRGLLTTKTGRMSLLVLELQSVLLLPSLKSLRQVFEQLKKYDESRYFFGSFDYYKFQRLIECKLDALYKGKIKDNDPVYNTVGNILELISLGKDDTHHHFHTEESLDISRPFNSLEHYFSLSNQIEKLYIAQIALYEDLEQNSGRNASKILRHNKQTYEIRAQLEKIANMVYQENESLSNLFSFMYPMLIFYYSLITYDLKKASKILTFYNSKLLKLLSDYNINIKGQELSLIDRSKNERKLKTGDRNIIEGITIKVALDENNSGMILQVSCNCYDYLRRVGFELIEGTNKYEFSLLGSNIHDFLPPVLSTQHSKIMKSMSSLDKINRFNNDFMLDYRQNLLMMTSYIKISPSISDYVSSVINLNFDNINKNCSMLIMDENLQILSADRITQQMMLKAGFYFSPKEWNLGQLFGNIADLIALVYTLENNSIYDNFKSKSMNDFSVRSESSEPVGKKAVCSFFQTLNAAIQPLLYANEKNGVYYSVTQESILYQVLQCKRVQVQFEIGVSLEIPVVKLFVTYSDSDQDRYSSKRSNVWREKSINGSQQSGYSPEKSPTKSGFALSDPSIDSPSKFEDASKSGFGPFDTEQGGNKFSNTPSVSWFNSLNYDDLMRPVLEICSTFLGTGGSKMVSNSIFVSEQSLTDIPDQPKELQTILDTMAKISESFRQAGSVLEGQKTSLKTEGQSGLSKNGCKATLDVKIGFRGTTNKQKGIKESENNGWKDKNESLSFLNRISSKVSQKEIRCKKIMGSSKKLIRNTENILSCKSKTTVSRPDILSARSRVSIITSRVADENFRFRLYSAIEEQEKLIVASKSNVTRILDELSVVFCDIRNKKMRQVRWKRSSQKEISLFLMILWVLENLFIGKFV